MIYRQDRVGVRARMNTPLPRFTELLGRDAPFGTLDQSDINRITYDEKWYGDGEPRWPEAPTARRYFEKQRQATKRLSKKQFRDIPGATETAAKTSNCKNGNRCGSDGCYPCRRCIQRWLITSAKRVFSKPAEGYQDLAFNFVFPAGQASLDALGKVHFDTIAGQVRYAIENTNTVKFGLFAFDISLNDVTAKFAAGRYKEPPKIYWQVHIYGIVRTSNCHNVLRALKLLYPKDEKIYAPVKRRRSFDGSNKAISYLLKPEAWRRISYRTVNKHGRKVWITKPAALKAKQQVEYLVASDQLGFDRRITLINLHPVRLKSMPKRKGGVGLRLIKPRSQEM